MAGRILAAAWLNEADYPEHLRIVEDNSLQPTWQEWLASANQHIAHFERNGDKVHKVVVNPKELASWCAARGAKVDAKARSLFAAEHVGRKIGH